MTDVRIMASHQRDENVRKLCLDLKLGYDAVTWDDRVEGGDAMYTARKAWLEPLPPGATHRLVLQDDVEVCNDFIRVIDTIVNTHPSRAITCINFLHPSNFPAYNGTPYFRVMSMPGCAIILPKSIIRPCMDWCDNSKDQVLKPHDDLMISGYCREHEIMMVATWPSIVQHPDNDTLLGKKYAWKRTSSSFDVDARADWTNPSILLPR